MKKTSVSPELGDFTAGTRTLTNSLIASSPFSNRFRLQFDRVGRARHDRRGFRIVSRLAVAGAAAGMSATFSVPLVSVLLAFEILLFEWNPRSLVPVVFASATA